jgi:UTP--glucose-1-phosphate uridylyltransferase
VSSNLTVGSLDSYTPPNPTAGAISGRHSMSTPVSLPRVRKAVIPAAGLGVRLQPLTLSQPKELLPCGPRPVMGYILDELRAAGVSEILLVSRTGKAVLEDYVHASWPGACVVRQPEPRGLGNAILVARSWVGQEPFVVALGDTIIQSNRPKPPLSRLIGDRTRGSVVLVRRIEPALTRLYGIVDPGDNGDHSSLFALRGIIEKPEPEHAPSALAIAGRYLFEPEIFEALAELDEAPGAEIQLTDAMTRLAGRGAMFALPLQEGERRFDIGNFESYYEAFAALSTAAPVRGG